MDNESAHTASSGGSDGATNLNGIIALDGIGQAELIARGECTVDEVLDAAINRIEELNPKLNAVIHPSFEKARNQPEPEGEAPFRGVPILYKDLMCTVAGEPHHCGSRALKSRGATANVSSYMDQSFRAAGFRFLGRTNTPEFGMAPTTEPLAYGPTLNPWDFTRSPGGSSGGSAAAVASGMVPIAHGNDGGGSIRIPASVCGLVGLKPTRARVSVGPEHGESGPMGHQGVLTRSVRDTAAVLDILGGVFAGDPYVAPPPFRKYMSEAEASPEELKGLRVGFMTNVPGDQEELDPECKLAVEKTCKLLSDLGCEVVDDHPKRLDELVAPEFGTVMNVNLIGRIAYWEKHFGEEIPLEELEPMTALMAERARSFSALEYIQALETAYAYSREVCGWWGHGLATVSDIESSGGEPVVGSYVGNDDSTRGFDILVTPTLPMIPWKLGELSPEGDKKETLRKLSKVTRFTSCFNVTGQPAISLPLHWTSEDASHDQPSLPVGVQLVAKYGRDDLLLRLAFALEPHFPRPN